MKQRRRKGVLVNWWRPNVERADILKLGFVPPRMYAWFVASSPLHAQEIKMKLQAKGRQGIEISWGFGSALPDTPLPQDDRLALCGELTTAPFRGELQF